jgi:autotransporter-associated beta strand protein
MKPRIFFPLASAALALATHSATAATFYWDNNGTATGFGNAGGNWAQNSTSGGTSARWKTDATGVAAGSAIQATTSSDTFNFGTATYGLGAGTITVNAAGVTMGNTNYGSASGAVLLTGGTITFSAAPTITVNNTSNTINNIIAGAGTSFTKAGTGTLILGGANSYTGSTAVSTGGILRLQNTSSSTAVSVTGTLDLAFDSVFSTSATLSMNGGTIQSGRTSSSAGGTHAFGNMAVTNATQNFQAGTNATGSSAAIQVASITNGSVGGGSVTLNPTTASLIVVGGYTGETNAGTNVLTLGGTSEGNSFGGAISNGTRVTQSVTVNNTGVWTLAGNNTHNGLTTVGGSATLTLSGDNSGAGGGVSLSTGGTGSTTPRLNVNSATALGTGTLSFGGGAATDTVRLDNTSTGLVNVSTNNAFALNRNFTFIGTQSLDLGNMTTTLGGLTSGTSRIITVTANTLTFGGSIGEAALNLGISKSGAGTLVFNSANTYSGTTTISNSGGTLRITDAGALGTGNVTVSTNSTNTGTLELALTGTNNITNTFNGFNSATALTGGGNAQILNTSGINTISSDLTVAATGGSGLNVVSNGGLLTLSGTITHTVTSSRTLSLGGSGDGVVSGAINDNTVDNQAIALNKSGNGTWTISNASNGYTGATTIAAGTLKFGNNNVIANASAVTLGSATAAGTLDIAGFSDTIGTSVVTTMLTLGTNSTTVGGLQNQVINSGGSAVLSIDGGIAYNAGALGFNNGKALISANLQMGVTSGVDRNFTVNDSTATAVELEVTGILSSGTNGVGKSGAGTLFLNNDANTFTGQFLMNAGTVQVTKLADAGSTSSLGTGSDNSLIRLSDALNATVEYLGSTDSSTNRRFLLGTNSGASTNSTILNNGAGKLTFSSSVFNNTTTSVIARTLTLGGSNTLDNTISGEIRDNAGVGGTVGVTKQDAGTWILEGDNTYKGTTTVTAGTLIINGNQSTATGAVAVSNADTRLMGTGTVGGETTINAGAIHSAGSATGAVGNQNFSSSLTYANGSIFEWDINANDTATGFDTLVVAGALNGSTDGDTSIFRVVFGTTAKDGVNDSGNAFWNTAATSRDWSMSSIFGKNFTTGLFTTVETYDSNGIFDVSAKGSFTISGSSLTWTAVPEPTSALAGLLIGAGLLRRRRSA